MHKDISIEIRRAAMDLLARREHSSKELTQKLSRRFDDVERSVIQNVIQKLSDDGLQSDRRFAESYIRSKSLKGIGPVRIKQELTQKGVDSSLIGSAIQESEINWWDVLEACVLKKYGGFSFATPEEKAKCIRFLAYRGFSSEMVYEALD